MSKYIPPADAARQLTEYRLALFKSLADIKTVYPDEVRAFYRAVITAIANDEPDVVKNWAVSP